MTPILPSKAQLNDEVTFEVGTAETIPARIKAIKFHSDGDITYDLLVPGPLGGEPVSVIENVHSSLVTLSSAYQVIAKKSGGT